MVSFQRVIEELPLSCGDPAGSDLLIGIADEDEDAIEAKGDDFTPRNQLGGLIQVRTVTIIQELGLIDAVSSRRLHLFECPLYCHVHAAWHVTQRVEQSAVELLCSGDNQVQANLYRSLAKRWSVSQAV